MLRLTYKGLKIPEDLIYIVICLFKILNYKLMIQDKRIGPKDMIIKAKGNGIKNKKKNIPTSGMIKFKKIAKVTHFLLIKVFKTEKPCLIRSLILYEYAYRYRLKTEIYIGTMKKDTIEAHSWIMINDELIFDKKENIDQYTILLKGVDCA